MQLFATEFRTNLCWITSGRIKMKTYLNLNLNKLYRSYRNKLHEESSSLKKEYGAKQVSVDNCNDIGWRTEWIWISVGLGEIYMIIETKS